MRPGAGSLGLPTERGAPWRRGHRARAASTGGEGGKVRALRSPVPLREADEEAGFTALGPRGSGGRQSREGRAEAGPSKASCVWEEERALAEGRRTSWPRPSDLVMERLSVRGDDEIRAVEVRSLTPPAAGRPWLGTFLHAA